MKNKVIQVPKELNVKNTLILISLMVLNNLGYCQDIIGKYCKIYEIQNVYYSCLEFNKNGQFEYHSGGDLGDEYYGYGYYKFIKDENIISLIYSDSTLNKFSGFYRYRMWQNNDDKMVINLKVMDVEGNPLEHASIVDIENKLGSYSSKDGMAQLIKKKSDKNSRIDIALIGYDNQIITIDNHINYEINVYLSKYNYGVPIKNQLDTLKIVELKNNFFKVIGKDGKIINWSKID